MTVQELRQKLFEIEDQNAKVVVVTSEKYGEILSTLEISLVGLEDDPEGYITLR